MAAPPAPSRYYQAPEGHDIVGKLAYTTRVTGVMGAAFGVIDAQLFTKPKGYIGALGRVLHWTWPAVGMSTAFVTTTYIATNLRQKDDSINYALGGAAAGSIFGTWRRSAGLGLFSAVVLALVAALKKEAVDGGYTFIPKTVVVHQSLGSPNFDWTLTSHIPGNWTSGRKDE